MGKGGVGVLVAGIITLGACASSHRATSAPIPDRARTTPTTTTPRRTTTTRLPGPAPAFSFDHSVPPPPIVDTGTDYVAITESLERYGNWLGAHRPDPALVLTAVAPGTPLLKRYVRNLANLRNDNTRAIEKLNGPTTYTVLSATPNAFSVRLVENISVWQIVDVAGTVTSELPFVGLTTCLDVFVLSHGRWYFAASDIQQPPVVHL